MKRLFVGCRVRVVGPWLGFGPSPRGHEGRITASGEFVGGFSGEVCEWEIEVPGWDALVAKSEDLEPIQDPGHQIVSWSECLWQPEGMPA